MTPVPPGAISAPALGAAALSAAGTVLLARAVLSPRSSLFGPVISRSPNDHTNAVALTFDDGPWPGQTEAILDTLTHHGIRAAFFVIGRYAERHPMLVARMHAEGHLIGNHTFDHSRLGMFHGLGYWVDQIRRTADVVHGITGCSPALFRPPMGFKSPLVMRAARACGTRVVTWTRRAFDGVPVAPETIVARLGRARAGEILLLHDGRDPASDRPLGATAAALPAVIERVRARGLDVLSLDSLLAPASDHRAPTT